MRPMPKLTLAYLWKLALAYFFKLALACISLLVQESTWHLLFLLANWPLYIAHSLKLKVLYLPKFRLIGACAY